jgi:hypothetical protein
MRHTSHVTRHTPHVTCQKSHVTHHTSHVTSHTSHVTHHTSHITRHLATQSLPLIRAIDLLQLVLHHIIVITVVTMTAATATMYSSHSHALQQHFTRHRQHVQHVSTSLAVSLSSSLLSDLTYDSVMGSSWQLMMRWRRRECLIVIGEVG